MAGRSHLWRPIFRVSRAKRMAAERQRRRRLALVETLEPRIVLNGRPLALDDLHYITAQDTALLVGSQTALLTNKRD